MTNKVVVKADSSPDPSGQYVQSLARGLSVIRAFNADHPEMTLSEIAQQAGLTRATSRRFLLTLVELGYVRSNGRFFVLTPRVLELGFSYLTSLSLPEIAQPHLEFLAESTNESSSASVLDGADIVYIARVPIRRIMSVQIHLGTRFPAYATSMGRVLLSGLTPAELDDHLEGLNFAGLTSHTITSRSALINELERVKKQDWAVIDQELEEGLRSIAVPIRHSSGAIIAAINVSTTTSSHTVESINKNFLPPLKLAAERISTDLAACRPFSRTGVYGINPTVNSFQM